MRIIVKAKPGSKKEYIECITPPRFSFDDRSEDVPVYKVAVHARAVDGTANTAIIKAVAAHFDVAPSLVRIVSGAMAKQKIVAIDRE